MTHNSVRVRFAPAPTGFMHLGNVRTALLNYLFSKKYHGQFVIRLEDTDADRNFDPNGKQIIKDLAWLGLEFQEGPDKGGPYAPYQQSLRTDLYQEKLEYLQQHGHIYHCFCTEADLQKKRERAVALKIAPRYDRTCLKLSPEEVQKNIAEGKPFLFRFKVPNETSIYVKELARGLMTFESQNFSDFPLTRSDCSFTFIFANMVDDMMMNITHVLRGEDHLSNTANQVMMYMAFGHEAPTFWHLPIICNVDGKKLSKRDFGFALKDLVEAGYLPEAINNYLAIIGGSFAQEIMSIDELVTTLDFESIKTTGAIKYDVDKLRWINQKWIQRTETKELTALLKPILEAHYPKATNLSDAILLQLIEGVKAELTLLVDVIPALNFYFEEPILTKNVICEHIPSDQETRVISLIQQALPMIANAEEFMNAIKSGAKQNGIALKVMFTVLRFLLTGTNKGPSIVDIINLLGTEVSKKRIEAIF